MPKGRPKAPPPLSIDLTRDAWELLPECLERARLIALTPAMMDILTVLTNERPSRNGETDGKVIAGYENCLGLLTDLLKGKVRQTEEEMPEPTYDDPTLTKEMKWQK